MLNYQKVFLRDGKLGSGIPLHRICISHGTSSPAARRISRGLHDCVFAQKLSLCRDQKKAVPKLHSSGAQDRWRSLVPGDLNHATGLTMPRVIHQKLLTRWPWFVFWKTFLIRLNNVQKTHRQSGDFTNRNGMDTRKNSGEFPGKKQLQAMCFFFLWGHSWRDFPGQIYITENPMGKFHHVKMGWEPMVNWSPSSHPIWIRGHWVYLNPEHGLMMPQGGSCGPSCGPAHMTAHNPVFHRFCVDEYLG